MKYFSGRKTLLAFFSMYDRSLSPSAKCARANVPDSWTFWMMWETSYAASHQGSDWLWLNGCAVMWTSIHSTATIRSCLNGWWMTCCYAFTISVGVLSMTTISDLFILNDLLLLWVLYLFRFFNLSMYSINGAFHCDFRQNFKLKAFIICYFVSLITLRLTTRLLCF